METSTFKSAIEKDLRERGRRRTIAVVAGLGMAALLAGGIALTQFTGTDPVAEVVEALRVGGRLELIGVKIADVPVAVDQVAAALSVHHASLELARVGHGDLVAVLVLLHDHRGGLRGGFGQLAGLVLVVRVEAEVEEWPFVLDVCVGVFHRTVDGLVVLELAFKNRVVYCELA